MIPSYDVYLRSYEEHFSQEETHTLYEKQPHINDLLDADDMPVLGRHNAFEDEAAHQAPAMNDDVFSKRELLAQQNAACEKVYRRALNIDTVPVLYEDEIANLDEPLPNNYVLRPAPEEPQEMRIREKPVAFVQECGLNQEVPSASEAFLGSALLNACKHTDAECAKLLIPGIRSYETLRMQDFLGETAISYASKHRDLAVVYEQIKEKLVEFLYNTYQEILKPNGSLLANRELDIILEQLITNEVGIDQIFSILARNDCSIEEIRDVEQKIKERLLLRIFENFRLGQNIHIANNERTFLCLIIKSLFDYKIPIIEAFYILRAMRCEKDTIFAEEFIRHRYLYILKNISNSEVKTPE